MVPILSTGRIRRTESEHAKTQDNYSSALIIRLIYGSGARVILLLRQRNMTRGRKNAAVVQSGQQNMDTMKIIRFPGTAMADPTIPGALPIGGSSHFLLPGLWGPASCLDMQRCPLLAVAALREAITPQV
ncbi:hypothetical protein D3C81_1688450 [compost metagenome]